MSKVTIDLGEPLERREAPLHCLISPQSKKFLTKYMGKLGAKSLGQTVDVLFERISASKQHGGKHTEVKSELDCKRTAKLFLRCKPATIGFMDGEAARLNMGGRGEYLEFIVSQLRARGI